MDQTINEVYWRQRARVNWLQHGDGNDHYFHVVASGRRRKNHILGLVNHHKDWTTTIEGMEDIVVVYFNQLFGTT